MTEDPRERSGDAGNGNDDKPPDSNPPTPPDNYDDGHVETSEDVPETKEGEPPEGG